MREKVFLTPAEYIVHVFGGVRAAARALGRSPCQISKWKSPEDAKGCGGRIPSKAQKSALDAAKTKGLDLTAEDLIVGREIEREARNV